MPLKRSVLARFSEKVSKVPSGCWLWNGARNRDGYGVIGVSNKKRAQGAHRVAYELYVGYIPRGKMVCHECDNKRCVNPKHLYIGDAFTNARDAVLRGQQAKGARHGSHTHPERWVRGDRHYLRRYPWKAKRGSSNGNSKLSAENVCEIRRRCAAGESQSNVARRFRIAQCTVSAIVLRRLWCHTR